MSWIARVRRVWVLLLSAGLGVPLATAHAEVPGLGPVSHTMTVWSAERGLPGDIFAIGQDLEGYLWLGTPSGLIRFDGLRFSPWASADPAVALPTAPVHAIVGAVDGSLWVGFGGGGVVRIHRGEVVQHSRERGAPPGAAAMIQDRQGAIWVAARRGLFRFADDRWTLMGAETGYSGAEAFSLYEDRAGHLWVGTTDGVYRWTNGSFELVDAMLTNVQSLTEDDAGAIWVTDSERIMQRLSTQTSPTPGPSVRLPTGAWRLLTDRRGQLWAAAFGGGLLRVATPEDPAPVVERIEYEHRLAGSPRAIYEDREQNIWVGMRGGLLRLSESSFVTDVPLEGLNNDGVRTSTVGPDGSVWVATGHGLNRYSGSAHEAHGISQTMALHADRHGTLWVATSQEIGRLVDGRLVPIPVPDVVRSSRVMAMTTDARGRLWICSSLRGVMAWDGAHLSRFEAEPDISDNACSAIYTDRQDRVWIGMRSGGAAVHERGRFQTFGVEDGLAGGTVLGLLEDRSGAVWISSSVGLSRFQNGRIVSVTRSNLPLVDVVPVLVDDEEGYLWIGVHSGAGIIRVHPGEFDKVAVNELRRLEYTLYDESDGMQQGSQTWQAGVGGVRAGDGRLWVATGLGLAVIDPRNLPPARRPVPPRIEAVVADGSPLTPLVDVVLPASTSTLAIEYGTISLSSASKLRFRYMIDGVDADWVDAVNDREAIYTNLPSGDYRFRVSAGQDSHWTEATSWSFSVAPPFYLTRGFVTAIVGGVLLLLATAWWMRLRAVREQYALVFAERTRVSREIHDTLLQSLAALGMELEAMASQLEPQSPGREWLRRLRHQVAHSLRDARESILELRHDATRPRALIESLRDLTETTTRTKGAQADLTVSGPPRRCSADADFQLFRIAQEAVNNAVKHGQVQHVRVLLAYETDRVVLTIVDDGRGFTPEEHAPASSSGEHLGLLTMQERAARIGGRLAISSSPGGGTTIEANVPLAAH